MLCSLWKALRSGPGSKRRRFFRETMHFQAVRTCSAEWRVLRVYAKNENNHAEDGKSIRIRRDLWGPS